MKADKNKLVVPDESIGINIWKYKKKCIKGSSQEEKTSFTAVGR